MDSCSSLLTIFLDLYVYLLIFYLLPFSFNLSGDSTVFYIWLTKSLAKWKLHSFKKTNKKNLSLCPFIHSLLFLFCPNTTKFYKRANHTPFHIERDHILQSTIWPHCTIPDPSLTTFHHLYFAWLTSNNLSSSKPSNTYLVLWFVLYLFSRIFSSYSFPYKFDKFCLSFQDPAQISPL